MNTITELLNLEDSDILIADISIQGTTKTITLETKPTPHYCPICGFKMHSRGVKQRTIKHPVLQDNYELILILKQRRRRCTNKECLYDVSESFKFVNKRRRTTNATDMLIVMAYRNLMETSTSIANRFHVSDTYVHEIFERYVKMDRLTLTDVISVDEVHVELDEYCKYALVIQDFHTGDPIDLLRSRRSNVTEPYFVSIPPEERAAVKYLISDMYNQYINYVDKYFPNAVPVVDSFHVIQWITRLIDNYLRQLLKKFRSSEYEIFREFADLLEKYQDPIINSFVMVEKYGHGEIYDSRISNGPMESLNRKVKDLKRLGRGYKNFEHFRNRFLYSTRSNPVLNGSPESTQVQYFENDDF